jgi:hypothetical protein
MVKRKDWHLEFQDKRVVGVDCRRQGRRFFGQLANEIEQEIEDIFQRRSVDIQRKVSNFSLFKLSSNSTHIHTPTKLESRVLLGIPRLELEREIEDIDSLQWHREPPHQ